MLKKIPIFIANILKLAITRPFDLRIVFGTANAVLLDIINPEADTRPFRRVEISDISEVNSLWRFQSFSGVGASISLSEAAALVALMQVSDAKRVFEFGTYKGVSTTQLALNIADNGMVFTLDLPEDHPAYTLSIPKAEEREIAAEGGKGILIPSDLLTKVTFLRADSALFDTTPYLESMDMVFVDGAHSYDYVKNDTEKGLEMLRPGGVIAWHDCIPSHPDVVRYLKESGLNPRLVCGTTIAFSKI